MSKVDIERVKGFIREGKSIHLYAYNNANALHDVNRFTHRFFSMKSSNKENPYIIGNVAVQLRFTETKTEKGRINEFFMIITSYTVNELE
jgi:hypothetical protein